MAAVIRDAGLQAEPVLLITGRARPLSASPSFSPSYSPTPPPREPAGPSIEIAKPAPTEAQLRRQLEAERNQVLQQAREAGALQGQEQGYAAGLDQGRAEWADRVAALDALLASLSNKLEAGIAGSEDLMVEIVFESVSKIIGNAALRREGVAAIVQQALQGIGEREILVLRLAPRDVDLLRDLRAELTRFADCRSLELVADERVELGGCLIETSGGGLDGRLETQFQRLRDLLLAARGPVESKT